MNRNLSSIRRKFSNRSATQFAVTVPYTIMHKQYVFDLLEDYCEILVVSSEKHYNGDIHHHLFLQLNEKITRTQMRTVIESVYGLPASPVPPNYDRTDTQPSDDSIYVATVRNKQKYLAYITKEDPNPIFKGWNVNEKLSFYFKCLDWAKNRRSYDVTDPFVLQHPQYYKLLREVFLKCKHKESRGKKLPKYRPVYYCVNRDPSWQDKVIEWWNDWVINGFKHKKAQLYLWGPSNVGKTTFINNLLKMCIDPKDDDDNDEDDDDDDDNNDDDDDYIESHIFRPTPNEQKYAFQEWDRYKYNICIIDEFQDSQFDLSDLKKAIAGECFVTNCKYDQSKKVKLQVPILFISNFDAPKDSSYYETRTLDQNELREIYKESEKFRGFRQRLFVVEADKALF